MGCERSASTCKNLKISLFMVFILIFLARLTDGVTNPTDVAAINKLYVAMGSPVLPGWVASGGDPCGEAWQGVQCNDSNILRIVLNVANLRGELGDNLHMFTSIKGIDLSNNHIGGSIPSNLPVTMQTLFLSDNQFTGSIPDSLSSLNLLTAMSINNNLLTGELPDSFQSLTGLINLDLSSNNISGKLPPSFRNMSTLTTLRLQSNHLSGTLDVLQDLPLKDLNIENNLFSGPIPEKLQSIPNFRKDGNPFNSTVSPSLPPKSPPTPLSSPPISGPPTSGKTPAKQVDGPSTPPASNSGGSNKSSAKKTVVWISITGVSSFIILVLAFLLCMPRFTIQRGGADAVSKRHQIGAYEGDRENPPTNEGSLVRPANQMQKVPKEEVLRSKEEHRKESRTGVIPKLLNDQEINVQKMGTVPKREDEDVTACDVYLMPPPSLSPPPPPPLLEKVNVDPVVPAETASKKPSPRNQNPLVYAKSFTIAELQQYTNSFSSDHLLGAGMLGSVYRAQLPDGKLLAVKKLDKRVSRWQKDNEFTELVNNIDRIRHANVVELLGYCSEHGQRLLIYEYCSKGSLKDALHSDDEFKKKLSWNTRIRMALGAARALEYLHEVCEPAVVHRNFKSVNILLDDDLSIRLSECGLAPLISSGSVSQLSGHLLSAYGYGAPEFESGVYTNQSDVFSFGVVMLELLTGRKSYDRTRNRGEQFLVRWAIPQLHDIDALSRMVDPSLHGQYPTKSLSHFADIISRCVQSEQEFRPPISEVVQDLLDMIQREHPRSGSNED